MSLPEDGKTRRHIPDAGDSDIAGIYHQIQPVLPSAPARIGVRCQQLLQTADPAAPFGKRFKIEDFAETAAPDSDGSVSRTMMTRSSRVDDSASWQRIHPGCAGRFRKIAQRGMVPCAVENMAGSARVISRLNPENPGETSLSFPCCKSASPL